jgi:SAM-dependent methyltransferase
MAGSLNVLGSSPKPLVATGERFLPGEMQGRIVLEHLHRYIFASQLVQDKVVLDIASGEGYGSFYLAKFARRVIGVDIAEEAVDHARAKYVRDNLVYQPGSCTAIPLADGAVDVIVSFETIEHHAEHEAMMRELKRVLRPGGLVVISSPDRLEYSDKPSFKNPYHVKELYFNEFQSLIETHFMNSQFFGQRVLLGSTLFNQNDPQNIIFYQLDSKLDPEPSMPMPLYWVAVASDQTLPATTGGILEQSLAGLCENTTTQQNINLLQLIKDIADPSSERLKTQLRGSWYLDKNQDIAAVAGIDPYEHWQRNGVKECRIPAPDPFAFARELVMERVALLRHACEESRQALLQAQNDSLELKKKLEAEVAQARSKAIAEGDAQIRLLGEQIMASQHQMLALHEQHAQREHALQLAIAEKEREIQRVQTASVEQSKLQEKEIVQNELKARQEKEGLHREIAEREQIFLEKYLLLQQSFTKEVAEQKDSALQKIMDLSVQHAEQEKLLRDELREKELKLSQIQNESLAFMKDFSERLIKLQQDFLQERVTLTDQYLGELSELNKQITAIRSSWTWRLTAPFRSLSSLFGARP